MKKKKESSERPMPKERPIFAAGPMRLQLDFDNERFSSGVMRFKFEDTSARVMQGEKEIGSVNGCVGGGVEISIGPRAWYLSAEEIWAAAQVADEAYLKGNDLSTDKR